MPIVRPLTAGERAIVGRVFGPSVDCDRVRIHNRRWLVLAQPRDSGMAPRGHVYMHGLAWRDDYAAAGTMHRAWFVHEMTHVWQYQNRVCVPLWAGASQMLRTGFRYGRCYDYRADAARDLLDYNLEQQARIVEHWYLATVLRSPPVGYDAAGVKAVLARFLVNPAYPRRRILPSHVDNN